jgi:chromosomal replication initiation ATPase DnaA
MKAAYKNNPVKLRAVLDIVAEHYCVDVDSLLSRERYEPVAEARNMVMYVLLRQGTTQETAASAVNREHGTAAAAYDTITNLMDTEPGTLELFNTINQAVEALP